MVGWHRLNGHEFEQALGVGDGQGSLACYSPWGCKEATNTFILFFHGCYPTISIFLFCLSLLDGLTLQKCPNLKDQHLWGSLAGTFIPWPQWLFLSLSSSIHSPSAPSFQSLSCVRLSVTSWTAALQASLSITNSQSLFKLMSIESVIPSYNFILCLPLSSHLQSFPASGSFPMNQFFTSGSQSIGASASASVLPMNIQDWFPLG